MQIFSHCDCYSAQSINVMILGLYFCKHKSLFRVERTTWNSGHLGNLYDKSLAYTAKRKSKININSSALWSLLSNPWATVCVGVVLNLEFFSRWRYHSIISFTCVRLLSHLCTLPINIHLHRDIPRIRSILQISIRIAKACIALEAETPRALGTFL